MDHWNKEQLFADLAGALSGHSRLVLLGGDFNSCLHPAHDRSNQATAHVRRSDKLSVLTQRLEVVDVLRPNVEAARTAEDCADFHHWVRHAARLTASCKSDHDGVAIRVAAPEMRAHMKSRNPTCPVPAYARDRADDMAAELFDGLHEQHDAILEETLSSAMAAAEAARWWDAVKTRFKVGHLQSARDSRAKLTSSHRQRIRRLERGICEEAGTPAEERGLRRLSGRCDAQTRSTDSAGWFFARIATKFGVNTIFTLESASAGCEPSHLANTMAKGWAPVMQQPEVIPEAIAAVLHGIAWSPTPTPHTLAGRVGEEELRRALRRCKCYMKTGSDRLSNDWYRDDEERLVPLLLRLFRFW
ncbi:hypothetical protein PybrP1_008313 [[Pythium] brassicae (nom. inval.)]|nr:hypothetical protein PybrP1_008313 [[Pythium] brassicae (nom. inval.)]